MRSEILEQLARNDAAELESAHRDYPTLIRATETSDADGERIRKCMTLLGITPEQVQADLLAIALAKDAERRIVPDADIAEAARRYAIVEDAQRAHIGNIIATALKAARVDYGAQVAWQVLRELAPTIDGDSMMLLRESLKSAIDMTSGVTAPTATARASQAARHEISRLKADHPHAFHEPAQAAPTPAPEDNQQDDGEALFASA